MKRVSSVLLVLVLVLSVGLFVACQTGKSAVKPQSKKASGGGLLEGVGGKASVPKAMTGDRVELKERFKALVTAYLAEDKDTYLAGFDNNVLLVGNALLGKSAQTTKAELTAKVEKEFQGADLTQAKYDEAFGPTNEPWVMSSKQLSEKIPAWRFGIHYDDLRDYVKDGDYLVIGKPNESLMEKNVFLNDIYFIFRKQGDRWVAIGRD